MFKRKIKIALISLLTLAALGTAGLATSVAAGTSTDSDKKLGSEELAFHDAMRKLWEDHITWTRMFIVEFAADSPATQATAERLLQNQVDIGDAIKPFYGDEAGDQLTALLQDHILTAADILTAAKAGDQEGVEEASARWYANANDIAAFLSSANPDHWPLEEMRAMMREHLDLTLAEAVARLQGDFQADIAAYDEIHGQILEMADMLSAGIVAQFPKDF
ncbi:MAG TPA: hypothetical protein VGS09_09830 [Actinomycetota bacterium]|jgi:hypothetical protein|nr:hypothetical protein [Actinomycetota bacterium]